MVDYEDFRSPMPEPKMFQKGIGKGGSKTIYDVPAEDITRQDILNLNNLQKLHNRLQIGLNTRQRSL